MRRGGSGPAVPPGAATTPWGRQGCDLCRAAWTRGGGEPLRLLGVNLAMHARVHRCARCGAFWDEGERGAAEVPVREALALLDGSDPA